MKTNNTRLKLAAVVTDKTNEIEEQAKQYNALRDERDKMRIDRDERRAVLVEFVDSIDKYFAETAFQYATGLSGNSLDFSEGPELEDFFYKLHPYCKAFYDRIQLLLEQMDRPGVHTQGIESEFDALIWDNQRTNYKLGILVGARLAGYSPEKVRKMAEFLVNTLR